MFKKTRNGIISTVNSEPESRFYNIRTQACHRHASKFQPMEGVPQPAEQVVDNSPLWKMACSNDEPEMRRLLTIGSNTEVRGGEGLFGHTTPLQIAVRLNNLAMVEILLEYGADVHVRNHSGETLLFHAVETLEDFEAFLMVRVLIKNHAVIDAVDYRGWTALHEASRTGNTIVIGYLIGCNADVTLKTYGQQTASDVAKCTRIKHILKVEEVKAEQAHLNDSCLAFAMGQHERLGEGTDIHDLHPELMRKVLMYRGVSKWMVCLCGVFV